MKLSFTDIAGFGLLLILLLAMTFTESGSVAGVISAGGGAGERITGHWTSYSPTRFGDRTVEFFGNGSCVLRVGMEQSFPCKWHEPENGQSRVEASSLSGGGTEVFWVAVAGDNLILREPARETQYVRSDSRAAQERKAQIKG